MVDIGFLVGCCLALGIFLIILAASFRIRYEFKQDHTPRNWRTYE